MKLHRYFSDGNLTKNDKDDVYDECMRLLDFICISGNNEEVLIMLEPELTMKMMLGKNTF